MKATILIAFLFLSIQNQAQDRDSLHLKHYDRVIYRDTSIVTQQDITIPFDSSIIKVKRRRMARFYYDYMFSDPTEDISNRGGTTLPWAGKVVGDIHIRKIEPFGTSIADTSKQLKDWFINVGNDIHMLTRDRVILNSLLFETGDFLSLHSLEESERLLRKLPYILDANVFAVLRTGSSDTVDVYVITKDVFSITPYFSPSNYNEAEIAIEEANMLGLGQKFYNNFIISTKWGLGYEGQYTVFNLYGTYLEGNINVAFTKDSLLASISNERAFISHEIRNAGGFSYHYRVLRYYSRYDESRIRTDVTDNTIDGWYGRSFPISTADSALYGHLNFVTSGRVLSAWYSERPYTSADTNLMFQHNMLLLGKVGFSRSAFIKDILIAGFGVVEDVPIGILADVTAGYQVGEFVNRPYIGFHVSNGTFGRAGYFYNLVEVGSLFQNRQAEDGALRISSIYISKLIARRKLFKERVLFRLLYVRGINRTRQTDQVDLQDLDALRGINSELIFGNTALAGGITLSVFSPWYLLGFRVAFFTLADLTYFSERDEFVFSARPHWGFSSGIRLNNENFLFGTIDFNFAINPAPPPGVSVFSIGLHINPIFSFPDFNSKKPGMVTYGQSSKLYY